MNNRNTPASPSSGYGRIPEQFDPTTTLEVDSLEDLAAHLQDGDFSGALGCLVNHKARCGRKHRDIDLRRLAVTDKFSTVLAAGAAAGAPLFGSGAANQLLVTSGTDIIAAIVANAGMVGAKAFYANGADHRRQVLDRTMTALKAHIYAVALEGVDDGGTTVYVYSEDLSEAIERALGALELTAYVSASANPGLNASPLRLYAPGKILPKDLYQAAQDDEYRIEITAPDTMAVINPDHPTKVHVEVYLEAVFEDVLPIDNGWCRKASGDGESADVGTGLGASLMNSAMAAFGADGS